MRKIKLLTLSFAPATLGYRTVSCKDVNKIIWSAQSESPDAKWLALAHTENTAGPGNNAQWTTVELNQTFEGAKPVEVLTIDEQSHSVKSLTMTWPSSSHLSITYKGGDEVLFQAIKALGNEITFEHLPN